MFATALVSFFALSALAPSVSAVPSHGLVRNVHRSVPTQFKERGYAVDAEILEPYGTYVERYQLFDCEDQHNTTFWDGCCHPLLKDESEDALPESCWANVTDCDEPTTSVHSVTAPITTSVGKPATTSVDKPVTTSVEKPATTSTPKAEPTTSVADPVTTSKPHTTTTHAAAPTTSTVSTGGSWISGGFGTYYYQQGNYGACGDKHGDSDLIVAIDHERYGSINAVSSLCGKKVNIVNTENGNTVTALIADVCPTCINGNSLDMSLGTFQALQPKLSVGQLNIKYQFV